MPEWGVLLVAAIAAWTAFAASFALALAFLLHRLANEWRPGAVPGSAIRRAGAG